MPFKPVLLLLVFSYYILMCVHFMWPKSANFLIQTQSDKCRAIPFLAGLVTGHNQMRASQNWACIEADQDR